MSKNLKINKDKAFPGGFVPKVFNRGDVERIIDFLVLHHVEANDVDHAIEQFICHGVSAHFVIDEKGKPVGRILADDLVDALKPEEQHGLSKGTGALS